MLACHPLLWGLRSSGARSREGRPLRCWAGVSPTLEVSPGAVVGLYKWVFFRASRIFIPICTHLALGFPHTILFFWGKKNLQGWGCKRGAKLRESPYPLPHGPTHITAGRLQLPLTSWRW